MNIFECMHTYKLINDKFVSIILFHSIIITYIAYLVQILKHVLYTHTRAHTRARARVCVYIYMAIYNKGNRWKYISCQMYQL